MDSETSEKSWDTESLMRDFEVLQFQAPFVIVKRRDTGQMGSLRFNHAPRVYYAWRAVEDDHTV